MTAATNPPASPPPSRADCRSPACPSRGRERIGPSTPGCASSRATSRCSATTTTFPTRIGSCSCAMPPTAYPDFGVFGGVVAPLWSEPPDEWISQWVRSPPCSASPIRRARKDHAIRRACSAATWRCGPSISIDGHRFDERIGPDGTSTYAMGGETELHAASGDRRASRLLALQSRARPGHHPPRDDDAAVDPEARFSPRSLCLPGIATEGGRRPAARGARRERDPQGALPRAVRICARGVLRRDAGLVFRGRWNLNLWTGCLAEAVVSSAARRRRSWNVAR